MTNLSHWQDDIGDVLGGDFDGSLSNLCIMSLSFDFTRNGSGRENNPGTNQSNGLPGIAGSSSSGNKLMSSTNCGLNDVHNDNSNHFSKRFKQQHNANYDEENKSNNQNKIALQLQQLKNCLNTTALNTSGTLANHPTSVNQFDNPQNQMVKEREDDRLSPLSSEASENRASAISTPDNSSRSSTAGVRSPSPTPSQTCSSISTSSRTSSRSQSPSDMSLHGCNNSNNNNINNHNTAQQNNRNGNKLNQSDQNKAQNNDQQLTVYSVKDNLVNGSTLKESSYTTSVITTTAPMHFKSIHPFSLKQFPLSPYHQFSNSSLNHDFYDRYLSHDSHQPLQTPLIGIERTQDLLSLKLPPHGPSEDVDSQRFHKEWPFEDTKNDPDQNKSKNSGNNKTQENGPSIENNNILESRRKELSSSGNNETQKGFLFNYKSNSSATKSNDRADQREPIDLNVSYVQEDCCNNNSNNQEKNAMFVESMKHFNPERIQQNACCDLRSKDQSSPQNNNHDSDDGENVASISHQYHGQESMFGIDPSKQKFQHILAAPISVATKLNEDTMTYLNQGQAYEIKLENMTDVSEAKKGFMCSIINIGFHERHMQQAENELWHQWGQQHPNEKIFSVDMKLSYNVFGVESDGLNKYEFLWDSSKPAGVFIRINSISTEFTPKKHGGEKGVPFKLSIETFSYNSKTHDSFFISAACCQIKVFKPKGAERKIRSDKDKISKRPLIEQSKYHRSCDFTTFRECSLTSLHPSADGSLCYYRHSHGHFASKQVVSTNGMVGASTAQAHQQATHHGADEDMEHEQSHENERSRDGSGENHVTNEANDSNSNEHSNTNQQEYQSGQNSRNIHLVNKDQHQIDYTSARTVHHQYHRSNLEPSEPSESINYGSHNSHNSTNDQTFNHPSNDLLHFQQTTPFNQMYHGNQARSVVGLAGLNNPQHFGMSYYGHPLPTSMVPPHLPPPNSYGVQASNSLTPNIAHPGHGNHNFSVPIQQHMGAKCASTIYRQLNHDKQPCTTPVNHTTPFKTSNISSSNHNNFQPYLGNQTDHCVDSSSQEIKDNSSNSGNYQHDGYDMHLHHPFTSTASHNHQQPFRQRSASTSLTTTNGHCPNYMSHGTQSRNVEGYINQVNSVPESIGSNNHWIQGQTNQSQLASPNSICTQRSGSNTIPQNHDNHTFTSVNTYDCNNDNYDSEQNSPNKNHHHHTNDSTSSGYSRVKNSQNSLVSSCNPQRDQYEIVRSQSSSQNSYITANSNCVEVVSWMTENRFGHLIKTFNNFSGSDLLRLSKAELIEICGLIDGIRLYNNLQSQPIRPRRVIYVCYKTSEIFHPIYLYDVTLKELLGELSTIFSSHVSNISTRLVGEKHQKNSFEKSTLNSSSSTDSRSSIGTLSNETATEEVYNHGDHFFNEVGLQHRQGKCQMLSLKPEEDSRDTILIDRLLIDGMTSVKIVATEKVVQMLEDTSVWTLNLNFDDPCLIEACLTTCRRRTLK